MKFYNGIGPNPKMVRMFLAEKGLDIPVQEVDIQGGENRQAAYMSINPTGGLPSLELDDGRVISEITVICEYLEELYPEPVLIGASPEERAETRMWTRRIDLKIVEPMTNAFRYGKAYDFFKDRVHCVPQAAADLKAIAYENLAWLDGLMDGKTTITGERVSLADLFLYAFLFINLGRGDVLDPSLTNITRWYEMIGARPSAQA